MDKRTIELKINTDELSITQINPNTPFAVFPETVIYQCTIEDDNGAAVDMSDKALKFAAKDPSDLSSATFLLESTDTTDDWTDLENGKAAFTVDTNTSELQTYLGTSLDKKVAISIKNTTDAVLLGQAQQQYKTAYGVITGDEGSPTAAVRQHNFAATEAPDADDDTGDGYEVGSLWYDVRNDKAYTCLDATAAAAVWHQIDVTTGTDLDSTGLPWEMLVAVSDETTDIEAGTAKVTFRMPRAVTLATVRASVATAPVGRVITVDINDGGTTILSTKLTIDAGEKTSTTAATPPVISDTALADDAEMTIDIDTVGSSTAGAGLKVLLRGTIA